MLHHLTVREFVPADIPPIADYWLTSDEVYLRAMGVDLAKLPTREQFEIYLLAQFNTPIEQRQSYCIIWIHNDVPIGHSNTRPTTFADHALMHLHLWNKSDRAKEWGTTFMQLTLPYYFNKLQLQTLYCEPFAQNDAPNKTMEKLGFTLVKKHIDRPGDFGNEQELMLWQMSKADFAKMHSHGG